MTPMESTDDLLYFAKVKYPSPDRSPNQIYHFFMKGKMGILKGVFVCVV